MHIRSNIISMFDRFTIFTFRINRFGVLKIILFLYANYQYKILPHPTDHYNLFAFAIEERFPEKITQKKGE